MKLILFSIIILVSFNARAEQRSSQTYIVSDDSKTLYSIGLDLYRSRLAWKKLAKWNHLSTPYKLAKGQVIRLFEIPPRLIPFENQLADTKLRREFEGDLYIVNERAPTLSMVARDLYGNRQMANAIADWNKIARESSLEMGQRLKLQRGPRLNESEGTALLIRFWHRFGREDLVARMSEQPRREVASSAAQNSKYNVADYLVGIKLGGRLEGWQRPHREKHSVVKRDSFNKVPPAEPVPPQIIIQYVPVPMMPAKGDAVPLGPVAVERKPAEVQRQPSHYWDGEKGKEPTSDSYWLGEEADKIIDQIQKILEPKSK